MNGKAHATASLVLSIPCGVAAYAATENVAVSVGAVVGCIAGILLTPDLDLLEAQMPWWHEALSWTLWAAMLWAFFRAILER